MDAMNAGPLPGGEGMAGLLAALAGGGGAPAGGEGPPGLGEEGPPGLDEMDTIDHIQAAMKHLMMAFAGEEDEERGHGLTKGMGTLQGILAGEQKSNAQLSALGG